MSSRQTRDKYQQYKVDPDIFVVWLAQEAYQHGYLPFTSRNTTTKTASQEWTRPRSVRERLNMAETIAYHQNSFVLPTYIHEANTTAITARKKLTEMHKSQLHLGSRDNLEKDSQHEYFTVTLMQALKILTSRAQTSTKSKESFMLRDSPFPSSFTNIQPSGVADEAESPSLLETFAVPDQQATLKEEEIHSEDQNLRNHDSRYGYAKIFNGMLTAYLLIICISAIISLALFLNHLHLSHISALMADRRSIKYLSDAARSYDYLRRDRDGHLY